ncbi:MAG TPA: type II toxin-antitoxin system prevent-host-death family antitoxin [Thermoanaerobaculia bacterium]|jgi:antitoxin (DNA-binding transcriptional repressor) of toxin-antitoxin stability system
MKTTGIRELKNRLSEFIRLVRHGEPILVTDRGQVVAVIRQPDSADGFAQSALHDLARQGKARLGAPNAAALYPALQPLLKDEEVLSLLDEERGER